MSIKKFFHSLSHAFTGLARVFRAEQNFRLQTLSAAVVVFFSVYFSLRPWEYVVVILMILMVMTMEILNTAMEYFSDLLKQRLNFYVRTIKDIMAGAVFLTSLGAVAVGLIIFLPHFLKLAE